MAIETIESPAQFTANWSDPGARLYSVGVDRGMIYTPNGVPWVGLISVTPEPGADSEVKYLDGVAFGATRTPTSFAAEIQCFTKPAEFDRMLGAALPGSLKIHGQPPPITTLTFSWRNTFKDASEKEFHEIHIAYGCRIFETEVGYNTFSDSPEPDLRSFRIVSSAPEYHGGYKPVSHVSFDSFTTPPEKFRSVEAVLYGNSGVTPRVPTIAELRDYLGV